MLQNAMRLMNICIHGIMQALERGGSLGLLLLRASSGKRSGARKWRAGTGKEEEGMGSRKRNGEVGEGGEGDNIAEERFELHVLRL